MFCVNCGTKNEDGAQFCVGCGAPLGQAPVPVAEPTVTSAPNSAAPEAITSEQKKYRMVGMITVATAAVLVLAILALIIFGGRGYKATTRQFIKSIYTANASKFFKLIPKKVLNEEFDSAEDRRDAIDEMNESLEYMLEWYDEIYEDWKYSYEIKDADKLSGSTLREFKEMYEDEYDLRIKAVMEVEVELTIEYDDGDEEEETTMTLYLIKVGSSWYVDIFESDML